MTGTWWPAASRALPMPWVAERHTVCRNEPAMQRETTLGRAGLALLAGAACGSVLIGLIAVAPDIWRATIAPNGFNRSWSDIATDAAFLTVLCAAAYAIGLLILAAPSWWLLHRRGFQTRLHALTLGVALSIPSYIVVTEWFGRYQGKAIYGPAPFSRLLRAGPWSWPTAIEGAVWITVVSGVTGLVIWRIAYRRCQADNR